MTRRVREQFAFASLYVTIAVLCSVVTYAGCRNVPFYRMTSKASQSLPLSHEGIAAYERGDFEEAERKLEAAVKLNDSDVETCRYYGETLWKKGKREESLEILRSAADKHGAVDAQVSLFCSLGEKSLEINRPQQAIVWANKIVDLSPKRSIGWELRGRALCQLDRPSEALADFQRAVHFSTDDRELLRKIASLQNEIGDYDAGLATWQCLERLYPTNREPAEVFAGKGYAYLGLGLLEEAQESYEIAVHFAPLESSYRVQLAKTAMARGDMELASNVLAEAVTVKPDDLACRELYNSVRRRVEQVAEVSSKEKNVH